MSKIYDAIPPKLVDWIAQQHLFFVATAPLGGDGLLNLSPKGSIGTFRVLDEHTVAYLDLTGSGIETLAHLRENGRIVLMFCAFSGRPTIVRLWGRGEAVLPSAPDFAGLRARRILPPIAAHGHDKAEQAAQMRGHGREVVFGLELAFGGAAEVAHQDNGRAVFQAVAHGGERGADTGVVADFAVFNRHVQVGTDQHGFAAHVLFGKLEEGHSYLF